MKNFTNRLYFIAFMFLLISCGERDDYAADARMLCEAYSTKSIEAVGGAKLFYGANPRLFQKQLELVKTKEFKRVVQELSELEFIREVYPRAQLLVGELIGDQWVCPDMQNFYTFNIEKDDEVDVNDLTRVEIIVASDGSYYYDDSLVVFSEPSAIPDSLKLDLDRGDAVEVVIHMRSGASDESLSDIFNYLAAQGVGNVKLLSEE